MAADNIQYISILLEIGIPDEIASVSITTESLYIKIIRITNV